MANPPKLYIPVPTPVVDESRHITRDWVLMFDQIIARVFVSGTVVGPASSVNNQIALFSGTSGEILKAATGTGVVHATSGAYRVGDVAVDEVVDALRVRTLAIDIAWFQSPGAAIPTGVAGFVPVPWAGTITQVQLLSIDPAVTSGSIVVDIWKDTYANYPPTVADTITAAAKPTLSSAIKSVDSTLTGWTTSLAAGDVLGFNVDSVSTVTRVLLTLTVQLT